MTTHLEICPKVMMKRLKIMRSMMADRMMMNGPKQLQCWITRLQPNYSTYNTKRTDFKPEWFKDYPWLEYCDDHVTLVRLMNNNVFQK